MSIIVSAPGKVLIAGGYIRKYSGIIVRKGTSALRIQVRSPQFMKLNGKLLTVKVDHDKLFSRRMTGRRDPPPCSRVISTQHSAKPRT